MSSLPDVSPATIGIVAACCASLIVILFIVLLVCCCRRSTAMKEERQRRQQQHQHKQQQQQQHQHQQQQLYQTSDGKPYALVAPSSTLFADNVDHDVGDCSRRSSLKEETEEEVMGSDEMRRAAVFATLRSGHHPVDSSTSNPTIFNFSHEFLNNRSSCLDTDAYTMDNGHRHKKVVYEVVV